MIFYENGRNVEHFAPLKPHEINKIVFYYL